jgi:NarL family two-component system sensor histidine kinase YdfH
METRPGFFQRIKHFFVPAEMAEDGTIREVLPFFALVTLAATWMYLIYVRQISSAWQVVVFTLLMVLHLGLYWAVFRFIGNTQQMRVYFTFQGLLVFVIVMFAEDYGLAIGLYASLIGNAVGAMQEKRDLLMLIPGYLLLAALAIMVQAGVEVIIEWSFIALPSILFSGFIAFLFRRQLELRDRAEQLLSDLKIAHTRLEEYTDQVETLTRVQERQRIARELHDTLAQELTGMVLQLEAVSAHIQQGNDSRAQEILRDAMAQSRGTLAEARQVIDDLRSAQRTGLTLPESIQAETERFEEITRIDCQSSLEVSRPVREEIQLHLTKITAEGLNNIARHARANRAQLMLRENAAGLTMTISDDGIGFQPERTAGKPGHYGLVGIQERVALLGGSLKIDSQPGQGTTLEIIIPQPWKETPHE